MTEQQRPRVQLSLFMILCIQAAVSIAIAVLAAMAGADLEFNFLVLLIFPVVCCITLFAMVSGSTYATKWMGRKMARRFIAGSVLIYIAIRLACQLLGDS